MNIVGRTENGEMVVDGLFKLFDTSGLPLADVFHGVYGKQMVPSWPHFFNEAINAGWKKKTILLRVREALIDSKGVDYAEKVIERLASF